MNTRGFGVVFDFFRHNGKPFQTRAHWEPWFKMNPQANLQSLNPSVLLVRGGGEA